MDFLKRCTTNVHLIENVYNTSYAKFSWKEEGQEQDCGSRWPALLIDLRQRGILCARVENELYLFNQGVNDVTDLVAEGRYDLQPSAEWMDHIDASTSASDGRLTIDVLLEAIHGLLSLRLAERDKILRIQPWTWLCHDAKPNDPIENSGVLLRLKLNISASGALYATSYVEPTEMLAKEKQETSEGETVMLAPSGIMATVLSTIDRRNAANDVWKNQAVHDLQAEGINVRTEDSWLLLRLDSATEKTTLCWPARLCIAPRGRIITDGETQSSQANWTSWFAAPEKSSGFQDPLVMAEQWHATALENQRIAADAAQAQMDMEVADKTVSVTVDTDSSSLVSPPFLQRTHDQNIIASGIYPTPPDGLIQHHTSQQHSSDGVTAHTQLERNETNNEILANNDDAQDRGHTSSSDPPAFEHHTDDLFGDAGGMDFGGDEVGDADFDFFNEQEEENDEDQHADRTMIDEDQQYGNVPDATMNTSDEMEQSNPEMHKDADRAKSGQTPGIASSPGAVQPLMDEDMHSSNDAIDGHNTMAKPLEKPLSPFSIRERLLPPPIPASAAHDISSGPTNARRSSKFDSVTFRDGLDVGRKYSSQYATSSPLLAVNVHQERPSISLPVKTKKPRIKRPADRDSDASSDNSESEEDSYESASSFSDDGFPPKLPWDTKKRKRGGVDALSPVMGSAEFMNGNGNETAEHLSDVQMQALLGRLVRLSATTGTVGLARADCSRDRSDVENHLEERNASHWAPIEDIYKLSKLDMTYVAQIVSEQAVSCVPYLRRTLGMSAVGHEDQSSAITAVSDVLDEAFRYILPSAKVCDVARLALVREPPNRNSSTPSNPRLGLPRPTQRSETANLGPDIMPIPPPYIRVRRGNDVYEMLPPSLEFWEPLSFAPSNGPKDIRAFAIFPFNEALQGLVTGFLGELGTVYENCRLGSHTHPRQAQEDNELDVYQDGLASVRLGDEETVEAALVAYGGTCSELGTFLASIGQAESERTIVIYMVDPFPSHVRALHPMSACFWQLCKAYRAKMPKHHRNEACSDIVLQIVPIDLIASTGSLVTLNADQLGAVAKEVYNRCPRSSSASGDPITTLQDFEASFVELASLLPKRIGFQLTAEPQSDLLHEGSVLHLAYALSPDRQWMTVAWTDSSGRYNCNASFCLCGRSFADVAEVVWERTRDIMATREVTWRVFILTTAHLDESIKACWRKAVDHPRRQPFSTTLLSAELEPSVKLTLPEAPAEDTSNINAGIFGSGFLTPVTTPQGTAMTVSPDTNGANAPPTPAPSESAAATITDNDPDAHLVDVADESWGMLFSPIFATTLGHCGIANGALYKRGQAGLEAGGTSTLESVGLAQLPSLALSLLWTVQVRPNGHVDEGNVKQAEMMLREVLKLYRHLSVLTKARRLHHYKGGSVVPVHLAVAVRGAAALDGFLA